MAGDKSQLLEMGFEEARVNWALRATKNAGLQPAMDHILANMDNDVPEAGGPEGEEDGLSGSGEDLVARSIKCSDCGKIFRSQNSASLHAEKSGHENFEESTEEVCVLHSSAHDGSLSADYAAFPDAVQIKPLTDEEKKAKIEELRAKLAEKRATQSKEDAKEAKANEKIRRKAGQDFGKIKEDLEVKEIAKDVERRKAEKLADQKARAAIKAQIEADKKERAEKAAREKAARAGQSSTDSPAVQQPLAKPSAAVKSSDNPDTRLQIRLSVGGQPLTKTFPSDNTLIDVAEFVASENLAYDVSTVTFASTFPRKTYSRDEMSKTLKENGLTPSAVLMAS
ncbi:ubiquitin-related domain-containing protein [Kockovaella imperatae]|uniref:Ubiquitin-related domain-containing protein n=1 Tax=Kockovaella imperatae TaxID=4999 RepID=A0A1Y1UDJ0_9TREE|nr:ubiquitin-related domain-containing protein [Kockovaella imperatae]ORX35594.1 ubiquitin-related domain-containing protein [Kockovaella imperatae]